MLTISVAKSKIGVANCQTLCGGTVIIAPLVVAMGQWAGSHWKGTFVVGRIGRSPEHPVLPLARFRGCIVNLLEPCYVQSTREGGHEHRG